VLEKLKEELPKEDTKRE